MTPEEIRTRFTAKYVPEGQEGDATWIGNVLAEIAAQLAELNEKFADYFATDPTGGSDADVREVDSQRAAA